MTFQSIYVVYGALALLFILNIVLLSKYSKLNKRFTRFITHNSDDFNLEELLASVIKNVDSFRSEIDQNLKDANKLNVDTNQKFDKLIADINSNFSKESEILRDKIDVINNNLNICIQKTAVVRYNPFDHVGGELCFALALLDKKNDGVIINTIFTENASYTYCKPVLAGVSTIKLSKEETDAINLAKNKI